MGGRHAGADADAGRPRQQSRVAQLSTPVASRVVIDAARAGVSGH